MDELEQQRAVARVALEAIGDSGFALAGSGAIREHGVIVRPTRDVDLFTPNLDPKAFSAAVARVESAWREAGWDVMTRAQHAGHTRFLVHIPDGLATEVELGVDWRAKTPARLDVGPVLDLEDAVGNKISALYGRSAPRDFLDVDAIRQSGLFSDAALLELSEDRDPGFDRQLFARQLQQVSRIDHGAVEAYEVSPQQWAGVQQRTTDWSQQILEPQDTSGAAGPASRPQGAPPPNRSGMPGVDEISGMPPGTWAPSM